MAGTPRAGLGPGGATGALPASRSRQLYKSGFGVEDLGQERLTPLLRLKYNNSIADAVADLGQPEEIKQVFAGSHKYLYAAGRDRRWKSASPPPDPPAGSAH